MNRTIRGTLLASFFCTRGFAFVCLPIRVHRHALTTSTRRFASDSKFLDQVETSVSRVLSKYGGPSVDILQLPPSERESFGVARNLDVRLKALSRNNDCRRCWLQRVHCICDKCPPLETSSMTDSTHETQSSNTVLPKVNRIFLLTHFKEICLTVDTAKLILAGFPETCRLVIGGLSSEYQDSMKEMEDAQREGGRCLVLFPTDDAETFEDILKGQADGKMEGEWDIIVIDGTWAQAQKLHSRYIQERSTHVQLSSKAVEALAGNSGDEELKLPGHQLRRHPIKWKEISTLEATRLLLGDMMSASSIHGRPWETLALYQQIGDAAAQKQLGTKRRRLSKL